MKKPTTISKESVSEYREFVELRLRKRVLEVIEVVLAEEVDQVTCSHFLVHSRIRFFAEILASRRLDHERTQPV